MIASSKPLRTWVTTCQTGRWGIFSGVTEFRRLCWWAQTFSPSTFLTLKGLVTYDGRSNVPHIMKKDRPLVAEHFAEFEKCYGTDPHGKAKRTQSDSKAERWRSFDTEEVKKRDYKIDSLRWLKDDTRGDGDEVLEPEELATDAIAELQAAVKELTTIITLLENGAEANADSNVKVLKS